jgi:peptidylprolyl isomerase domain and WD repeat-containing protein 1
MINMIKLDYVPQAVSFIHSDHDPIRALAISEKDSLVIRVYDAAGTKEPLHVIEKLHYQPVHLITYNSVFNIVVSTDKSGMLEYWSGQLNEYNFPKNVNFESNLDTDLYEFAKEKTIVLSIAFTRSGKIMAVLARDRKIRVYNFLSGKIVQTIDESLDSYSAIQQQSQQLGNMEFGRRVAIEKDIDRNEASFFSNLVFDESGSFLFYSGLLGIKMYNLETCEVVKYFGKIENARFLHVGLFQGITNKPKAIITLEMKASNNPNLQVIRHDPTLFCTAYKKNRFYLFTRREPEDTKNADNERDVFNEKPTKEEIVAATEESIMSRLASQAVIHTTKGDIQLTLFYKEVPKTVENFAVHSRNSYYNGHIFHRCIKQFMVQTGDPTGTGTGGTSIWNHEFEDEFHPNLKHDKPYTVSMANAGPNTNGSQFFITVIPCPWLDKKHTVFGRVTKGMDIVAKICNVKTDKQDKPFDEIKIISISVK